jgi:hypothetical protein
VSAGTGELDQFGEQVDQVRMIFGPPTPMARATKRG